MTDRQRRARSRADKQPLSLDAFVSAALSLLRRGGTTALTLRGVARELETGPASLYAYVDTIQDLHELVLDAVLGEVDLHEVLRAQPRERLLAVLGSYREALLTHEGLAQLAAGTLPNGQNSIRLTDTVLGCLLRLGVADRVAAWGYDLLMLHVTAGAAERDRWRTQPDPVARARGAYAAADAVAHPHAAHLHDELFSGSAPQRFEWGLTTLLTGIEQTRP
ncbi:TetR/AcrR family transcriptional regulator [Pseudonocardia sp. GCM10023141]|uniref:TetR/AcrR family transcriptional regulator n=1 Tax=Pseudonocardia sp. GCM10023141 TaxID=3252653 RepID=UPI00361C77F1